MIYITNIKIPIKKVYYHTYINYSIYIFIEYVYFYK